jgi:hypothetical protein
MTHLPALVERVFAILDCIDAGNRPIGTALQTMAVDHLRQGKSKTPNVGRIPITAPAPAA